MSRFSGLLKLFVALPLSANEPTGAAPTSSPSVDKPDAKVARASQKFVTLEQAHELLSDWQLEDALAVAQTLLEEDPNNPEIWFLAGRVEHARGEHVAALALVKAALAEGVSEAQGFLPIVESSAAYAASFSTYETPHFKIGYLNKDEIVAKLAEPVLEAAYRNIGGDLEIFAAERGEKIAVEIYPDARGLAGATGLSLREIETTGTIAVCKFHRLMITSPLATANGYSWADTIAHEFTHLVISKKSHNTIPIWLHEGIAKFYESRWKGPAGENIGPYSENLLADATRSGRFVTFKQMHPSMAKLPSQKDAALAFAEVFTVIEFLREKYGPRSIAQVLDKAGEGVPLNAALTSVFGLNIDGVEQAWRKYVKKRAFHLVPGAEPERIQLASDDKANKEKPLEEIADHDANGFSRLGELLQRGGHNHAAIAEYEKAYAIAGIKHITLVTRLAKAYAAVGRDGDAVKVLEKALPAHPDDADAHLIAGRLEMQKGETKSARAHFQHVLLQNPFNPELSLALAKLDELDGDNASAERFKGFAELALKPRPTRSYALPSPRAGEAQLSLIAPGWKHVRIDGEDFATPLWNLPVTAAEHTVTFTKPDGTSAERKIQASAGKMPIVLL
ncbi:MAG: tetratricopeptide repeat protein [Clostridia bacterium]|nr:tetratricopeptide repeat protein [Deltaproteobacteria bacterium]